MLLFTFTMCARATASGEMRPGSDSGSFPGTHPISRAADGHAAKLCYWWVGPFRIREFLTPVIVRLIYPHSRIVIRKAHVSQLKVT